MKDLATIFQEAENHYKQGEYQKVFDLLQYSLDQDYSKAAKVELYYLMGKYKAAATKDESALEYIRQGREIAKVNDLAEGIEKGDLILAKTAGNLDLYRGQNYEALQHFEAARKVAQSSQDKEEELDCLISEGKAHFYLGQDSQARDRYQEAQSMAESLQSPPQTEARILGGLGDISLREGQTEEAQLRYQAALEKANQSDDSFEKIENYARLGKWHFYQGQNEQAVELLSQAVNLAQKSNNQLGEIDALGNLGKIYFFIGQNELAQKSYSNALELARKVGDPLGEMNNLGNLGNVFLRLGRQEEALQNFKEALAIARGIQDAQGEMNNLGWIGDVYYQNDENIKALNNYYKALELARQIGSTLGESSNLSRIGDIYFSRYENDAAFQNYSQALDLARQANSPQGMLNNLICLGDIYFRKGEDDKSHKNYEEALLIAQSLDSPQGMLNAIQSLAEVLNRRGWEEEALLRYKQALGLSRRLQDPMAEIDSLSGIGDVFFRQNKYKKARAHYRKAMEMAQGIDSSFQELTQKNKIGEIYLRRGKRDLAQKYFSEAYQLARKIDSPEGLLHSLEVLAEFDLIRGDVDEAAQKLVEAMALADRLEEPVSKMKSHALLGWISIGQGEFQEALKYYQVACDLLGPLATGDIEEESGLHNGDLADEAASHTQGINKLRQKVALAADLPSLDPQSPAAPPPPTPVSEDTGEFAPVSGTVREDTDEFPAVKAEEIKRDQTDEFKIEVSSQQVEGVNLEAPVSQTTTTEDSGEIVTSNREGKRLYRSTWKSVEKGLSDHSDPQSLLQAVIALGKLGDRRIIAPLEKTYYEVSKKERRVHPEIILGLTNTPGEDAGPALSRLFRKETAQELKFNLAEGMAKRGNIGGIEFLLSTLKSSNSSLQRRAAEALGHSGQDEVLPDLEEALEENPKDKWLRTTLAGAMLELGDNSREDLLIDALDTADVTNMFFTARAMARAGRASAVTALETIIDSVIDKGKPAPEEFVILHQAIRERVIAGGETFDILNRAFAFKPSRLAVLLALDSHSANLFVDKLYEALGDPKHWEIRANAAHALGNTKRESIEPLRELFQGDEFNQVRVASAGALIRLLEKEGMVTPTTTF